MDIAIEEFDGVNIITPQETRLDSQNCDLLRDAFAAVGAARQNPLVLVDLRYVSYIDSVGLGSLVSGRLKLKGKSDIRLCALQPNVETLVRLARLDLLYPIYGDRAEALREMKTAK